MEWETLEPNIELIRNNLERKFVGSNAKIKNSGRGAKLEKGELTLPLTRQGPKGNQSKESDGRV